MVGRLAAAPPLVAAAPALAGAARDAAVEDEILHCGYFADVVFKFRSRVSAEVEEVYGQRALFALLSEPLRRQLLPLPSSPGTGRAEVWLDGGLTAQGFREVARYVYGLRPCFTMQALPAVLAAARAVETQELEASALQWGLSTLRDLAQTSTAAGSSNTSRADSPVGGTADDALRCLQQLTSFEPPHPELDAWLKALLAAYSASQILASPAFFRLSPAALHVLLQGEVMCNDPGSLWLAVLHWGYGNRPAGAAQEPPEACEKATPAKLGARIAEALAPTSPPEEVVGWQRQLLPYLDRIRFSQMAPAEFAMHVESVDPMLPELRKAIYNVRRHGVGAVDRSHTEDASRTGCSYAVHKAPPVPAGSEHDCRRHVHFEGA